VPYTVGTPYLYHAKLHFSVATEISDSTSLSFGIRQVTSELTDKGSRLFKINGRRILIRRRGLGAGHVSSPDVPKNWTPICVTSSTWTKHHSPGRPHHRDELFNKTDELEFWSCPLDLLRRLGTVGQMDARTPVRLLCFDDRSGEAFAQSRQRIRLLYGSDGPPPADIEKMYLAVFGRRAVAQPFRSSASEAPTTVTESPAVK